MAKRTERDLRIELKNRTTTILHLQTRIEYNSSRSSKIIEHKQQVEDTADDQNENLIKIRALKKQVISLVLMESNLCLD